MNGHRDIEHSGEVSGFVSDNEVLVDDGAAVSVLTNQDAVGAASTIARLAAPVVAGFLPSDTEKQALDIYRGLQQGRIDRSLLAPNLSDYFTPEAIRRLSIEPRSAGRTAHLPPDRRSVAWRHDLPRLQHHLPQQAPEAHHLHLPRRQTRTIPDCTCRLDSDWWRTGVPYPFDVFGRMGGRARIKDSAQKVSRCSCTDSCSQPRSPAAAA